MREVGKRGGRCPLGVICLFWIVGSAWADEAPRDNVAPAGFSSLFNGRDLDGWKGLVADPKKRAAMSTDELATAQTESDRILRARWSVKDGALVFNGDGFHSICTARDYADFELLVDWKIDAGGDSGIYLRGSPQVQIWDPAQSPVGSGGLFNNQKYPSTPIIRADRPIGEWNSFRIFMVGERVTVYLNDVLAVNDIPLENYWERDRPVYPSGQIELQSHEHPLYFKNIFIREIPAVADRISLATPVVAKGDRVAIAGDSITEQKLYSRFIEDYLLACVPQLDLRVIQLGWSGERAPGFEARMENDLLPYKPDVVTTCYGMNDGSYKAYDPSIGATYRKSSMAIVRRLKEAGATVIVGSPGAVDTHTFLKHPYGVRVAPAVYNENLAHLRDIAREIAIAEGQPFANVFDSMINAQTQAKAALGEAYAVCGGDGIHPGANGQLVMAYAFLKSMGFDGEIGTITVDLNGTAEASEGHKILAASSGKVEIESSRYPFCFFGDASSADGTRSILPYVRFNEDLNRLTLKVQNLGADRATVQWGTFARSFSREQLEKGINLAAAFLENPFTETFLKVDARVLEKQRYETPMVKDAITRFRTIRRLLDSSTEAEKALGTLRRELTSKNDELHRKAREAVVPVRHMIHIISE